MPPTDPSITLQMLGGLNVRQGDRIIAHFRTQKTAVLLGYLACYLHRKHAREELIELLWPEGDLDSGRTSLRTALASLRRQLEPDGESGENILIADRLHVHLNTQKVTTDVAELDRVLKSLPSLADPARKAAELSAAVDLYHGPLLPGFYDDWVVRERDRVQALYVEALRELLPLLRDGGESQKALDTAHRILEVDPLIEETHADLMRLYAETGQVSAVTRQYRELERVLRQQLGASPSPSTQELHEKLIRERAPSREKVVSPPPVEPGPDPAPVTETRGATPETSTLPLEGEISANASDALPSRPKRKQVHLPVQLTRFIGREEELERLGEMLQPGTTRLLTLIGPGGTGKTRLAVEVVRRLTQAYENEVWFVPLADLTRAEAIPELLARTLDLARSPDGAPLDQAVDRLSSGPALLVLDNFEQVTDDGAELVQELLERTPSLTCLVTSRQRLNLGAERPYPVLPLPVPDVPAGPERLMELPSVKLFVDRAQSVRPDFQVTRENAPVVAALCERLEGLPLALELAAAWMQTLTPAQMLARMEHRFDLLTSRRKDISARHRTLRAAVEWSFHLLEPELQQFFARLSIFRGSWSIDAAESACAEPMALVYLQELQDRSLIVTEEYPESLMRFRMLETLREYAREQLSEEECAEVARRHLEYYLNLAEIARPNLEGPDQLLWMQRLEQNTDNFRVALDWARTHPDCAGRGMWLAARLHFFWYVRGYYQEGYQFLTGLLEATEDAAGSSISDTETLRARAYGMQGAAELANGLGNYADARALFERSLHLWREVDNPRGVAYSLTYLGILDEAQGQLDQAQSLYEQGLEIWRSLENPGGEAHVMKCLGGVLLSKGEIRQAKAYFEEGETLYRRLGNLRGITMMLGERARLALNQGDYQGAAQLLSDYLRTARELHDQGHIVCALDGLGQVASKRGDFPLARAYYEESLGIARELGNRQQVIAAYTHLGMVAAEQGEYDAAGEQYAQGLALAREAGDRGSMAVLFDNIGVVHCHRGEYESALFSFRESLLICEELRDRWGIARTLRHIGNASLEANDLERAAAAYEKSLTVAREIEDRHGTGMALYDLGVVARQRGDLETAKTHWEESLSLDRAMGVKGGSVLGALGELAAERGEFAEARRLWEESLKEHLEIGDRKGIIECMEGLADLNVAQGKSDLSSPETDAPSCLVQATRLYSAAETLRQALGSPLPLHRREQQARLVEELKAKLEPSQFEDAWAQGRALQWEEEMYPRLAVLHALRQP